MKYIGIDIGATNLKAGLVDDDGQGEQGLCLRLPQ